MTVAADNMATRAGHGGTQRRLLDKEPRTVESHAAIDVVVVVEQEHVLDGGSTRQVPWSRSQIGPE